MNKKLVQVGDVIVSAKFTFGYYENTRNKKHVTVDGKTKSRPVSEFIEEEQRVSIAAKTGRIPAKTKTVETSAYDPTRGKARFVVEEAQMQGGGTGHGPGDVFPDGWHIKARRLKKNGRYNPKGEVIHFYMTGCFSCMVKPSEVKIVGKMKHLFI